MQAEPQGQHRIHALLWHANCQADRSTRATARACTPMSIATAPAPPVGRAGPAQHRRAIRPCAQHSPGAAMASPTSWAELTWGVDSNVAHDNQRVAPVPCRRLNPSHLRSA
eukprot:6195606-Pleurochrysis_carterae.AAC.2